MVGLPFSDVSWVEKLLPYQSQRISPPAFYYGELLLPSVLPSPLHTYVDLTGWGKVGDKIHKNDVSNDEFSMI